MQTPNVPAILAARARRGFARAPRETTYYLGRERLSRRDVEDGAVAEEAVRLHVAERAVGDGVLRSSAESRGGARRADRVLSEEGGQRKEARGHPSLRSGCRMTKVPAVHGARGYRSFMLARFAHHRRILRVVIASALAVVASVRGGGIALACDDATRAAAESHATDMAGMPGMATSGEHERQNDGCDSPDQARECSLMAACAPAVSEPAADRDRIGAVESPAARGPERALASVDRSPDPPPPRF